MDRRHLAVACLVASVIAGSLQVGGARADDLSTASGSLLTLARQEENAHRDDRAAALYRQAHEAHPFDPEPLASLGRLAARIGAADEAVRYFEAALALQRRHRDARHGLADAFVELDRSAEALSMYEALLAEDASDGRAWNGKGLALDLEGRHDEAQTAYRLGLAVAPDDVALRNNLDLSRALAAAPDEPATAPASVTVTGTTVTGVPADRVSLALNAEGTGVSGEPGAPSSSAGRDP